MTDLKYGKALDVECVENYRNARAAYLRGDMPEAIYWYRKNRADHGLETFFEVELPEHLRFVHPIGCVLGRATYAPHMVFYQCSGVGSDLDGNRPTFKGPCVLFPGARVLGASVIGANVFITANTVVEGVTIPDNSVVWPGVLRHGTWNPSELNEIPTATIELRFGSDYKPTKRSVIEVFFK